VKVVADVSDWVVVTFRWEARGGKSEAATSASLAAAYRVKDGRISEAHFLDPEQALEAAGRWRSSFEVRRGVESQVLRFLFAATLRALKIA
jgi:hypothetical protein